MPFDLPPSPPALVQAVDPAQQPPVRLPESDVFVEVVGELPLRTRIEDVTRLLSRRRLAAGSNRSYPPTILELITLVEPRPARPPGKTWLAINALTLGYDNRTKEVIAEYCIEHCEIDPTTRTEHPQRRLVSYRAPEADVLKRVNKKLGSLQKYAPRPASGQQ